MNWYKYFDDNFTLVQGTKGWWRMSDPFDAKTVTKRDRTLAVHFEMNQVMGFRSGYRATIETFLVDLYRITYKEVMQLKAMQPDDEPPTIVPRKREIKSLELPGKSQLIINGESEIAKRARGYMKGRGFDLYYLAMKGVGYIEEGPFTGYISLPCYEKGKLVYYVLRDFLGRSRRYHNPPVDLTNKSAGDIIYNSDALDLFDTIYVTEGIIDALTVGPSCVATIGKELTLTQRTILLKGRCKEYIVLSDPNAYSRNYVQFAPIARQKSVKIVDLTKLDGDVNKVGIGPVMKLVEQTPVYNPLDLFNQKLF